MQRLKLLIRKPGPDGEKTVVLGRLGSRVVTLGVLLVVIALMTAALVFGYLVMTMVFAVLLVAIAVALIRAAFQRLRH